jgi:hypothetical protein
MLPASERAVPGMLNAIQWRLSSERCFGAPSGSCMMRAKLTVLAGTLIHWSGGETGVVAEFWVNWAGIRPLSSNAGVVRVRPGFDGGFPPPT